MIAIHSTALGPSLGGIRFWHYATETDALTDVLRLSEAMSLKAAAAGLHQGGGKAVVRWADPHRRAEPRSSSRVLGRAIHELGGRYIAAEDVGATTADMDGIAAVTPWVTGVSESLGGSGDPSPVTAVGVHAAMRAAARRALGRAPSWRAATWWSRARARSAPGWRACSWPTARASSVGDVDDGRVAGARRRARRRRRSRSADVLTTRADVVAPCALGGVLTRRSVDALACEIVCGGANNQLATVEVDDALAARGVLYAPDFVANAGGILNIAEEFIGYSRARALDAAARDRGDDDPTCSPPPASGASPRGGPPTGSRASGSRTSRSGRALGAGRPDRVDRRRAAADAPARRSDERGHHVAGHEQQPGEQVQADVGLHRRHERVRLVVVRADAAVHRARHRRGHQRDERPPRRDAERRVRPRSARTW